jgi:hypothetical protein
MRGGHTCDMVGDATDRGRYKETEASEDTGGEGQFGCLGRCCRSRSRTKEVMRYAGADVEAFMAMNLK